MMKEEVELVPDKVNKYYLKNIELLERLLKSSKESEERAYQSYHHEKKRGAIRDVVGGEKAKYKSFKEERKEYEKALDLLKKSYKEAKKINFLN